MRVRHEIGVQTLSQPVAFSAADLKEFTQQLKAALYSGLFICPNHEVKHETLSSPFNAEVFEITSPDQAFLDECKSYGRDSLWTQSIDFYEVKPGEKTHIIFRRNAEGKVDALATNMRSDVFRWLMLFVPKSMAFEQGLKTSDFWLVDQTFDFATETDAKTLAENKAQFQIDVACARAVMAEISKLCRQSTSKLTKREIAARVAKASEVGYRVLKEMLDAKATSVEKITGKVNKIAKYAYKEAGKRGYIQEQNDFSDPISQSSMEIVRQQVVNQLENAGILNKNDKQPRMVLFVGEGDGQNAQAIQAQYPHLQCFMVEPYSVFVQGALDAKTMEAERIFQLYAEELPVVCDGRFDLVIVFNYNVKGEQTAFFEALERVTKPGGKVVVGRSVCDPEHIFHSKTIGQFLIEQFSRMKIGNKVNVNGKEQPDYGYKQVLYVATKNSNPKEKKQQAREDKEIARLINEYNLAEQSRADQNPSPNDTLKHMLNASTLLKLIEVLQKNEDLTVTAHETASTSSTSSTSDTLSNAPTQTMFGASNGGVTAPAQMTRLPEHTMPPAAELSGPQF